MALIAAPIGLVVGLLLGALGGGGSILAVPALILLLGMAPQEATAGSLIIVGLAAVIGMLPAMRAGRVRLGQGAVFGLLGTGGAVLGALLSTSVPEGVLLLAFASLMLVVAALMTARRRSAARAGAAGAAPEPARPPMVSLRPFRCDCRAVGVLVAAAAGVGLLTGFFGVGGGFAIVPALVLALGLPMPVAVGTSLLVIAINSAVALGSRLTLDLTLDWGVVALAAGAAVVGSLLGSRITARVRPERLSLAFTVLLVVVALATAAPVLVAAA
ncbi:sulfite exporter TauE/SafE family protein [Agrococcus sp. SCSIO52902]|uniref:sulfite exporter TauE/SafE family protein n=1 Tax=Agrococcus sp. SCSIO52902 TaxID=2933290 RepID=UPI001FF4C9A5|nr:sulfite exporter TauE/SafE family protein [Agrococcus sp. SCSIO52902]UOW01764.1 sulfite exporter TauE/SafE family protein [Agrococcus sp. SCSIO52902]